MENETYQKTTPEIDAILKEFQNEGIDTMKDLIKDIEDLIEKRKKLSDEIANDLEKMKIDITSFAQKKGSEITVREIIELKKKELEVEEEKVKEKLNAWKDVANLKRELRIHVATFQNKMQHNTMLDNLIDF
jgi:hypothetical protein